MVERRWPICIDEHRGKPRVRIRKNGKLVFNQTLDVNINTKSGIAKAIKLRDEVKHRLKFGIALNQEEITQVHLFHIAAQEYLDDLGGSYSNHLDYESSINSWWMPAFGNHLAEEITTKEIKKVLDGRQVAGRKVSRKRKKNALIPLRGIFNHLGIKPNPADFHLKKSDKDQKIPVYRYLPEERSRLLSALKDEYLVYFAILFGCGLRPAGEVLALQWKDYNGKQLHVSKTITRRRIKYSTKTYVSRKVAVPTWVQELLNEHPTRFKNSYIFLNKFDSFYCDADNFNKAWKRAHTVTDTAYRIPYTCRHTRAAELLSIGIAPAEAAKQLGHSLQMFLATYSEFIDEYCSEQDPLRFEGIAPQIQKVSQKCPKNKIASIESKKDR